MTDHTGLRLHLTDPVRELLGAEGQQWLWERPPSYDCWHCHAPGDLYTDPTTVTIIVTETDPDLAPLPIRMGIQLFHHACRDTSIISVVHRLSYNELSSSPEKRELQLDEVDGSTHTAPFTFHVIPVLIDGEPAEEDAPEPGLATLVLGGEFSPDVTGGAQAWAFTYGQHFERLGFRCGDPPAEGPEGWSVRITPDGRQPWLAIRCTPAPEPANGDLPEHLWLGRLTMPEDWVTAATDRGTLLLLAGPVGPETALAGHDPDNEVPLDPKQVRNDVEDGHYLMASVPVTILPAPTLPAGSQ